MKQNDEITNYALAFSQVLEDVLTNEENEFFIDINRGDATEILTALVLSCGFIYNRFTGENTNYLEFNHLSNQLIFQYLLECERNKNKKQH